MLKKLACIGLGVMLVIALSVCGKENKISGHNKDGIIGHETSIEQVNKVENTSLTKEDILGHWEVEKATYKSTDKELPLQELYGTGISYGGGVDFFEDGTTNEEIGITSGEGGSSKITYTIEKDIIKVWINAKVIREYEYVKDHKRTYLRSLRNDSDEEYYLYFERERDEINDVFSDREESTVNLETNKNETIENSESNDFITSIAENEVIYINSIQDYDAENYIVYATICEPYIIPKVENKKNNIVIDNNEHYLFEVQPGEYFANKVCNGVYKVNSDKNYGYYIQEDGSLKNDITECTMVVYAVTSREVKFKLLKDGYVGYTYVDVPLQDAFEIGTNYKEVELGKLFVHEYSIYDPIFENNNCRGLLVCNEGH